MTDEDLLSPDPQQDLENMGVNQLHHLGNRAQQLGLIAGHGHHGGQYEILRQGKVILLSPQDAIPYLSELIARAES